MCVLFVLIAPDLPVVPMLAVALIVRALTDSLAESASRSSGSLNLSALIAVVLILVAVGMLLRYRKGTLVVAAVTTWVGIWTILTIHTTGFSILAVREGVRELSILAVGVIAFNAPRQLSFSTAVRIVQLAGIGGAIVAIFQLLTHSGTDVGGHMRSTGLFAHPNDAAVYFAIAATASLWQAVISKGKRLDVYLTLLFCLATLTTFSLTGFLTLLVMVATYAIFQFHSARLKYGALSFILGLSVLFIVTPVGSERISSEASAELGAGQVRGSTSGNSLSWRLHKWDSLIEEWKHEPIFGQGLGTTIIGASSPTTSTESNLPHSEYFRYLVESGVAGVALLLTGLWALFRALKRRRSRLQPSAVLATSILAGLLVNALTANTLLYTPAAYSAALLIGAALADRLPSKTSWQPSFSH